jgi:hypothetical protein
MLGDTTRLLEEVIAMIEGTIGGDIEQLQENIRLLI